MKIVVAYTDASDLLDRSLLFDFFWKFSVFECALKRGGFLKSGNSDAAEPDWNKFGEAIRGRFSEISTDDFAEAVLALKELSPHKQVVISGQLNWRKICPKTDKCEEEFVLQLLRVVRNNLFHGGKYPDGPVKEVAHDKKILRAALSVLEGCIKLYPGDWK